MRRYLLPIFLVLLPGCGAWAPSAADATSAARTIACTVCQATGGPTAQAAAHAEALRVLAEALAALAAQRAPDDVRALREQLAAGQEEQRRAFEKLLQIAEAP